MNSEHQDRETGRIVAGRRLAISVLLLGLGTCAFLVWYSFQQRRDFADSITEQFQSHQETIAQGVSRGIEGMVRRVTGYMVSMAATPQISDSSSPECRERIQEFYFANQDVLYAGYRMNAEGVLVYMYPIDENALNADISYQEHVKKLFKTQTLVVSGLFHAVEGFDAIAIHTPVYRHGVLDGSVAAVIPMTKITQVFIGRVRPGRNGYAWMLDENGTILDHLEDKYIGRNISDAGVFPEDVTRRLQEFIAVGEPASMKLGETLFAISPTRLGGRKWTVILSTPYEDISGPIARQWRRQWLLNFAVFGVMIMVAVTIVNAGKRAVRLEQEKRFLEEKVGLQNELRESRDELDMTLKTVPSGLYTVDRKKIVLSWNRTAERLTGYTAEEVIGKPCSIFSTDEKCNNCGMFDTSLPKPMYGAECWITTKTGERLLISKNLDYLRDARGNITGGIESFVDITEARRAENARLNAVALEKEIEQLRKMDEVKSNFLSMVSHELRTPLSVMLGNLAMARKEKYGEISDTMKEKLDVVLRRGWQLNDLIANLLDLAKIESGKLDLKKEKVYVAKKLDEVMSEFHEEADKKSLTMKVEVPRSAVVPADPSMFHRLLENLIGNAVKFTPDGGNISVEYRESGGIGIVSVQDDGPGIPEKALPRVFERFYQADDSSTRKYGGTGLGLSIAREIMEVHRGKIEMISREGEGAKAVVYFPLQDDPETPKSAEDKASEDPLPAPWFGEPVTFLYVGTDPEFLTALTLVFEDTAHRVISMPEHGGAALAIEKEQVRVVVVDLDIPGTTERELSLWKKLMADGYKFIVVSVSEASGEETHRLAALAGSTGLASKPLDGEQFVAEVKSLLQ